MNIETSETNNNTKEYSKTYLKANKIQEYLKSKWRRAGYSLSIHNKRGINTKLKFLQLCGFYNSAKKIIPWFVVAGMKHLEYWEVLTLIGEKLGSSEWRKW